jgi:hypothetical protein
VLNVRCSSVGAGIKIGSSLERKGERDRLDPLYAEPLIHPGGGKKRSKNSKNGTHNRIRQENASQIGKQA